MTTHVLEKIMVHVEEANFNISTQNIHELNQFIIYH